jgi:hypothetical protein
MSCDRHFEVVRCFDHDDVILVVFYRLTAFVQTLLAQFLQMHFCRQISTRICIKTYGEEVSFTPINRVGVNLPPN